jgi:uncharacterized protein (TIGR03086 family)
MNEITSARMAYAALARAIHAIGPADALRPTPCRDFTVSTLGNHLVITVVHMAQDVGFESSPTSAASLQDRVAEVVPPVLDAWAHRGETGDVVLRGRALPAQLALGILALELTVHGWDLAAATQHPFTITDDHAGHVLAMAHQTLTPESRRIAGFDDPVAIGDDASALDRLIAFTGRNPAWTPHSLAR